MKKFNGEFNEEFNENSKSRLLAWRRTINLLTRVDTILPLRFLLASVRVRRFLRRILDDFAVCFPECVPWEPQLGFTARWNNPNALFRRPVFDQDPLWGT